MPLAFVQGFERIAAHIQLATHFHQRRRAALQTQRNLLHRAYIRRHVLARAAIAARGRLHQHAVFIAQIDGQPVKLRLRHIVNDCIARQFQRRAHARIKGGCARRGAIRFRVNAEHGHAVAHLGKFGQRRAAHALRG